MRRRKRRIFFFIFGTVANEVTANAGDGAVVGYGTAFGRSAGTFGTVGDEITRDAADAAPGAGIENRTADCVSRRAFNRIADEAAREAAESF